MPSDLDIAVKLLSPKFRGVEFFCGPWRFGFAQDQAQHKYVDRDGAIVEGTGRAAAEYSFTAYLRNGIAGSAITQFPDNFMLLAAACANRTTGELIHPALGPLSVKPGRFDASYDPMKRDGVDVEMSFIESPKADEELSAILGGSSPMGSATAAARDLDNLIGNMNPTPDVPSSLSPSLLDNLKQIGGALNQFRLGLGNVAGMIDSYVSALDQLEDSIRAVQDPKVIYAPLLALGRLRDSLLQAANQATPKSKPVTQITITRDGTIDQLAQAVGMGLDDFLGLNPSLASRSKVAKGTKVFVNVAASAAGMSR